MEEFIVRHECGAWKNILYSTMFPQKWFDTFVGYGRMHECGMWNCKDLSMNVEKYTLFPHEYVMWNNSYILPHTSFSKCFRNVVIDFRLLWNIDEFMNVEELIYECGMWKNWYIRPHFCGIFKNSWMWKNTCWMWNNVVECGRIYMEEYMNA